MHILTLLGSLIVSQVAEHGMSVWMCVCVTWAMRVHVYACRYMCSL